MRSRRNPDPPLEPGVEGVGWAGLPIYAVGMLVGIYLLATKSDAGPNVAPIVPDQEYAGFAMLSANDQRLVMASPQSQRQALVTQLLSKSKVAAGITVDPVFLNIAGGKSGNAIMASAAPAVEVDSLLGEMGGLG